MSNRKGGYSGEIIYYRKWFWYSTWFKDGLFIFQEVCLSAGLWERWFVRVVAKIFDSIKDFLKDSDNRIYKSEIYAEEVMEILNGTDSQESWNYFIKFFLHITATERLWGDFEEKLVCFPFMNTSTSYYVTNDSKEDTESRKGFAEKVADKLSQYVHHQLNKLFKQWIKETYEQWESQLSKKFMNF